MAKMLTRLPNTNPSVLQVWQSKTSQQLQITFNYMRENQPNEKKVQKNNFHQMILLCKALFVYEHAVGFIHFPFENRIQRLML